jgi:hypothetical protein
MRLFTGKHLLLTGLIFGTVSVQGGLLSFNTVPSITSTEGSLFNGVLGTFTDSNTSDTAATFTATINWGDGSTSTPVITGGLGTFSLSGGHTYAEEGVYTVSLNVGDGVPADSATGTGTATLADAALSPLDIPPSFGFTPGVLLSNVLLLSFGDGNPFSTAADFIATIAWGDGSTTTGTISSNGSQYDVTGSYTYLGSGPFEVGVVVQDVGGSALTTQTSALGVPEPGTMGMVCAGLALAAMLRVRSNRRAG